MQTTDGNEGWVVPCLLNHSDRLFSYLEIGPLLGLSESLFLSRLVLLHSRFSGIKSSVDH